MPAGVIGPFDALGALHSIVPFRTLGPLRTLELRLPLRPIGAILTLRSFHAIFAAVLAAVGAAIFLPGMVGAAVFLPVGATVLTPVFLPVRTPVFLAIRAPVFLAHVGLRDRRGGAAEGQGGYGD